MTTVKNLYFSKAQQNIFPRNKNNYTPKEYRGLAEKNPMKNWCHDDPSSASIE